MYAASPMTGKDAFVTRFLAAGDADETVILVASDTGGESFFESFDRLAPGRTLRVLDCATELRGDLLIRISKRSYTFNCILSGGYQKRSDRYRGFIQHDYLIYFMI
jgi:hypothetical protein